jgi:UTP--glucose-1-phosphate uridylyltransferase
VNVETAVIPAAGRGTRMHPATRSVPKALLPVVDRPAIQWVIEEGMRAGVGRFIVVVNPGVDDLLFSHFEGMEGLEALTGFDGVTLELVVQEQPLGLGDAVLKAKDAVGDRPFFCMLGDNLVVPGMDQLGYLAAASDGRSVVCLRELDDEGLDRYGVAATGAWLGDQIVELAGAVEKPGVDGAPSRLGFVGRYLFTPEVFDRLDGLEPGFGGEIQLTDAIDRLGSAGRCLGYVAQDDLLDVGTPATYLQAVVALGLWHQEMGREFRGFLGGLLDGP